METVIITYQADLERALRAAKSISLYGVGNCVDPIHIVINDSPVIFEQAQSLFVDIKRTQVYHYTDISTWIHASSGWWSQQWLKLQAHKLVSTDWYMPFDSDMYLSRSIKNTELFSGRKAICNLHNRSVYKDNKLFIEYIDNACAYWHVDPDEIFQILRETPPNIMHRVSVDNMLNEMTPWVLGSTQTPSLEFFIYWVYLYKNNLTDMYQHRDNWFWFGDAFYMDND